ncbi:MAG: alpha/beta hydrolase fold domain-containing protein [Austwickia sp.]|jgi:monoterpene epsilon-lactone hydrolase|nr:MAG: alpha/beta hydrolase fold domain-containing protein [Austwickia sp.]
MAGDDGLRRPSRAMRLVTRILATEPKLMADAEAFAAAHLGRDYPEPVPPPAALRRVAEVSTEEIAGRTVFTARPRRGGTPWHLLYLHGGGYVSELFGVHWDIVLQLLRHTGATVSIPIYPLAPEHDHREGNAYVEAVYRELIRRYPPERTVLVGDSAGGGMALVQAMRYRDRGLPLPARLVLFAPATSVVPTNPEVDEIEPRDVILARPGGALAGVWWAGPDEPSHPDVSPLYGDPRGLPPVDMYVGTADILWPDARIMARHIAEAGGEVRLVEYPDAIHVFVGATFTPEAQDVYRRLAVTLGVAPLAPRLTRDPGVAMLGAPAVIFPHQVALRLHARGTPWIRHIGARAHLRFTVRGTRLEQFVAGRRLARP